MEKEASLLVVGFCVRPEGTWCFYVRPEGTFSIVARIASGWVINLRARSQVSLKITSSMEISKVVKGLRCSREARIGSKSSLRATKSWISCHYSHKVVYRVVSSKVSYFGRLIRANWSQKAFIWAAKSFTGWLDSCFIWWSVSRIWYW